ncbi:MAG: DUF1566 domain-containing protein, partial [Gammaproteobacteria bacterium]|nr:DUF1566 domain-containing protein [Gammaproteobacteria bacterium]
LADYAVAGVTGVTTDNLAAVNAAIDAVEGTEADTVAEIQTIVDGVIDAIGIISDYAADNTATTPTVANYATAGVIGVEAGNLDAVNAAIDAVTGVDADTVAEIQDIVDGVIGPVADAGVAQFVTEGDTVNLDATNSTDDVGITSYLWVRIDGAGITTNLNNDTIEQPTFTAPVVTAAETVTFQLTVTDGGGLTDTATVSIAIVPVINQLINDTGLTLCANYVTSGGGKSVSEDCTDIIDVNGNAIPEGQDADYGRDTSANDDSDGSAGFSFTKLDANGDPLAQSALSWSCVKDNVTGLIWEVKTTDLGLQDINNTYSWNNSSGTNDGGGVGTADDGSGATCNNVGNCDTEKYVTAVNGAGLCGATDWLLPTREQLLSIVGYSNALSVTYIDTNYFPNNSVDSSYWTSSPRNSTLSWYLNFTNGYLFYEAKSNLYRVRLVRKP